jgi:hypothetical protein
MAEMKNGSGAKGEGKRGVDSRKRLSWSRKGCILRAIRECRGGTLPITESVLYDVASCAGAIL